MSVENKEVNTECGICHKCAYKGNIPGDAHISCGLDWDKSEHPMPNADECGVRNGWYMFPINFDPTWQTTPCQEFSTKRDSEKVSENSNDPFMQMASLISKMKR